MSKRTFVLFGIFAVFFGLLLPYWAISKEGEESASPEKVAASDEEAKELFQTNCGACHTLARAGTDDARSGCALDRRGSRGAQHRLRRELR